MKIKIIFVFVIIVIIFTFISCDKTQNEQFSVILKYDKAIKEGNQTELKNLFSFKSQQAIQQIFKNSDDFYSELIKEGSGFKDKPPPKLKQIKKDEKNNNYRVLVILFNGKSKSFYLTQEGNYWKIDIIPQMTALYNAEKQFHK
ncbi:hypothetical protein KAU33_01110 [Candidatus Dependentiae bacterium]|nr:hypothetical protein [Candidatus Dependentiae bacterium]